jgi:hypothetical protein
LPLNQGDSHDLEASPRHCGGLRYCSLWRGIRAPCGRFALAGLFPGSRHWPVGVDGRPTQLAAGAAAGLYLWHDGDGWHAFVTHPGHDKVTLTINVTSQAPLVATESHDEHDDAVVEHDDDHTATLHADNFGYLDGMNFRTDCSPRIVVTGSVDGRQLTPADVFVGHGNHQPDHVPFVIVRKG